ncbi:MAG: ATP-binding cassette domain-containing protein, partial [Bacteroidales bacterium]
MSIQVRSLSKFYGSQKALDEVSLDISEGEIVGLLGPNGAGKSTLMKILTGYISPSLGSAKVCNFEVETQSLEVRKRVGYLQEHNPLYLEMYVREYLEYVAGLYTNIENISTAVAAVIEQVDLGKEAHKKIGALSKGFRQRVGLAQALIHNPAVLILDEPTSGLDPNQLEDVRDLIREISKNKTILFST